jgi:uncharacterized protein
MVVRTLADEEIERVLRAEIVGRIGCHASGRTYVVPVCYAYEHGAIYAHSGQGLKIEMMRQNPTVCFEVDHMEDLTNWDSAICWGTYQELSRDDAEHALELIRGRIRDRMPRTLGSGLLAAEEPTGGDAPVVFRLNLTELNGREERLYWELLPIATRSTISASPEPQPIAASIVVSGNLGASSEFIPDDVRSELGIEALVESCADTHREDFGVPEDVLAERDADARARATGQGDGASIRAWVQ